MMSRPNDNHKISKYLRATKNSNRLTKVLFQGLINQEGRVNINLTIFSMYYQIVYSPIRLEGLTNQA